MQELTFEQVGEVSGGVGQFIPFAAGILAGIAYEATGGQQTFINVFNSYVNARMDSILTDIKNGTAID